MLMLLSPAKRLVEGPALPGLPGTEPAMLDETRDLLSRARDLSAGDLQRLMGISDKLATLNHQRFQDMTLPFTADNARQAVRLFDGDVYRGLDAASLSGDDLDWAQRHVVILSGLYGALRPLDLVQPYRLEMGTKLDTERGDDLYAFWGDRITAQITAWLREQGDDVVVNLASHEYFSSVRPEALPGPVITPVFKDVADGKPRTISFYAKKARGAMARWAVEHRVADAERLQDCDAMGYTFQADVSSDTEWIYTRVKP